MKEILFSCAGLTVGEPHKVQAQRLYATIFRGESIALAGNANSGQQTFSQYLCGTKPRLAGTVHFAGAVDSSAERLLREKVFHSGNPHSKLYRRENSGITLMDYLFLMRRGGCASPLWKRRRLTLRAVWLLEQVGLARSPGHELASLTPLELCQLNIAKALETGADLVVLEENFEGYSMRDIEALAKSMERVKREHKLSFLLSLHSSRGVGELADRCFLFQEGAIVRKLTGAGMQQSLLQWMDESIYWGSAQAQPAVPGPVILEAVGLPCGGGRFDLRIYQGEILHLVDYDLHRKEQIFRIFSGDETDGAVLLYKGKPLPRGWNFQRHRYPITAVGKLADHAQFPNMTVQENLVFPSLRRLCTGGIFLPDSAILKTAEREWDAPRKPMPARLSQLTEPEKLALQMETLYLCHPQVIIFRDPFAYVDAEGRGILLKAFDRMRRRGTTVVVLSSSHTSYLGSSEYRAANWYDRLIDLMEVAE